jgi:hypothetical protein
LIFGSLLQENFLRKHWAGIHQADAAITVWDTGADLDLLRYVGEKSVTYPQDFVSLVFAKKDSYDVRYNKTCCRCHRIQGMNFLILSTCQNKNCSIWYAVTF